MGESLCSHCLRLHHRPAAPAAPAAVVTMSPLLLLLSPLLLADLGEVQCSLMSRVGLRLGGKPAHDHQIEHKRKIPWARKQQMMEDKMAEAFSKSLKLGA